MQWSRSISGAGRGFGLPAPSLSWGRIGWRWRRVPGHPSWPKWTATSGYRLTSGRLRSQLLTRSPSSGGLVTHRQRPGTANGVRFLNLEDETGLLNVIVLPPVWDANYEIARKSIGMVIEGVLEYRDGVTNLKSHRFEDWPVLEVKSRDFR